MIEFTVYGLPKGKARPRFVRTRQGVRTYTPKATETYQKDVLAAYMDKYQATKLNGLIWTKITAYFAVPKSVPKKRRADLVWYDKKPDADNIAKSVLDALQGIAYDDDKQVVALIVYKQYGDVAKVDVQMGELRDDTKGDRTGGYQKRAKASTGP